MTALIDTAVEPAHARIGPSSLARVIRCPGSVRETAGLPRTTTIHAAEGTLLHEIAANCLELGLEPQDFAGRTLIADGHAFEVTPDFVECMVPGLDWLRDQPGEVWVERRVRLDPWLPGQFGTLDVGLYDSASRLATVFDWKFGAGVPVSVFENEQLRAYGLGLLETILRPRGIEPERFRFIIEQPRCRGGGSFGEPWEISTAELLEFGEVMAAAGRAADEPDAPLVAGEKQCRFCDARNRRPKPGQLSGCATYDAFMLDVIGAQFDQMDAGDDPVLCRDLTAERRSWIVKHAKLFEQFLAKLHDDTMEDARAGKPTPGLKLVAGRRGDRKWSDEAAAEALLVGALGDGAFVRKLKTPAAAEKELAPKRGKPGKPVEWASLVQLVTQDDGKPVLVPEDDERPALKTVDQKFDDDADPDDLLT